MRRLLDIRALSVAAALSAAAVLPTAAAAAPATLRVGRETVRLCQHAPVVAYCGEIQAPLDRGAYAKPTIKIAFRWYPADNGKARRAAGTVVPVEGGPGYPSIGSVEEGFAPMYGGLLRHRNMLVVDNRGTGASTAIDCPSLQNFTGPTATEAYEHVVAECARALNERWHAPGGAAIHASDLFTSAASAADMAELLSRLKIGQVDLYGDSYGSYYAQVFAARYPQLIRSLTLDSTYSGEEFLPYADHRELVRNLDNVCARWAPCNQRAAETPWATIGRLAAMLRAAPLEGVVPGTHGVPVHVTMNSISLVDLLNDAAGDHTIYESLDAAARAALAGYPAPLLRLYEQRLVWDENYFGEPPSSYSVGLYTALSCTDYTGLYDMHAAFPVRLGEYEAAIAAAPPESFAPFTTREWVAQNQNTNSYSACLDWPAPTINTPPFEHAAPQLPPTMPVLVLGGELDVWTPPAEVPPVLHYLGGDSRFIEIANATHVVGETDTPCGDELVRDFVLRPQALSSLNTTCAAEPPLHAVAVYASRLAGEPAARLEHGKATSEQLRLIAAAVQTAGDGIVRLQNIHGFRDRGLNGGYAENPEGNEERVKYFSDRLVPGVSVSGEARLSRPPHPAEGKTVRATLVVSGAGIKIRLRAHWTLAGGPRDVAHISAVIAGRHVVARVPAP